MQVLVSDTSVLVDLERGSLLEASFRLPFRFSVPDLLYERELKNWGGEELIRLGLSVEELDGDGVQRALAYRQRAPALSLPDCFALALAQTRSWVLLSGDSALRQIKELARHRRISVNKLMEELSTIAITQHDAETRFRALAARGVVQEGLRVLDTLDDAFGKTG